MHWSYIFLAEEERRNSIIKALEMHLPIDVEYLPQNNLMQCFIVQYVGDFCTSNTCEFMMNLTFSMMLIIWEKSLS